MNSAALRVHNFTGEPWTLLEHCVIMCIKSIHMFFCSACLGFEGFMAARFLWSMSVCVYKWLAAAALAAVLALFDDYCCRAHQLLFEVAVRCNLRRY